MRSAKRIPVIEAASQKNYMHAYTHSHCH